LILRWKLSVGLPAELDADQPAEPAEPAN